MNPVPTVRPARVLVAFALACAGLAVLAGCSNTSTAATPKAGTARAGLPIAQSALSTMAPDAKLLLVQTTTSVTPTTTPVWGYLFGSAGSDKTYVVYVTGGKAMPAAEYGTAGLEATEWASVPGTEGWKIDSDAAYEKAVAASGMNAKPAAYVMGMITYVPAADATATTRTFTWYVSLDAGDGSGTATTVEVDAKTGAAVKQ
jgi:hypothetical protein